MSMSQTMPVLVARPRGRVNWCTEDVPEARSGGIVARLRTALIGTDSRTQDPNGRGLPVEAAAEVHAVGADVSGLHRGQRVVLCDASAGHRLAPYVSVASAEKQVALVPEDASDEQAAYCASTVPWGFGAAEAVGEALKGSVVVLVGGPVDLMAIAAVRRRHAGLIVAVHGEARVQDLARRYGADVVLNADEFRLAEAVQAVNNGQGADAAIVPDGEPRSLSAGVRATRPGATIVVRWTTVADELPVEGLSRDGRIWVSSRSISAPRRTGRLLLLVAEGELDPSWMTTHRFSFDHLAEAVHIARHGRPGFAKIAVRFTE
jgi:threonine dehydrogenase-like Zn-dependent dehydrogenase